MAEIDNALSQFSLTAIDDGKEVGEHPALDVPTDLAGRLHKALELLREVHADVAREEDDPAARALRDRAIGHIEADARHDRR